MISISSVRDRTKPFAGPWNNWVEHVSVCAGCAAAVQFAAKAGQGVDPKDLCNSGSNARRAALDWTHKSKADHDPLGHKSLNDAGFRTRTKRSRARKRRR